MKYQEHLYYEMALDCSEANRLKQQRRQRTKKFYEAAKKKMSGMVTSFSMLHL